MILTLNLKAVYFKQIKDGQKACEYRLCTPYWRKRLEGKTFDKIVLKSGYPRNGDDSRTIERPWLGLAVETIKHPHFGPDPVQVFAIRVN